MYSHDKLILLIEMVKESKARTVNSERSLVRRVLNPLVATLAITFFANLAVFGLNEDSPTPSNNFDLQKTDEHGTKYLEGYASKASVKSEFGKLACDILNRSLDANEVFDELTKEISKKHPFRASTGKLLDVVSEVVSLNASGSSKDGAKIILDQTIDWKEKDALIYEKQKIIDDLHPKIVCALLQVASGLGNPSQNPSTKKITENGLKELNGYCNIDLSRSINGSMRGWANEIENDSDRIGTTDELINLQKNITLFTEAAVHDDPVLQKISKELEHYAYPNRLKDKANNTLQTVLDTTAYMMPTASIAAAVVAVKGILIVSTGGAEDSKLLHLMFLSKRIASRTSALKEEINLAIHSRQVGLQTGNMLLFKCSNAILANLTSLQTVNYIQLKMDNSKKEPQYCTSPRTVK